MRENELLPCPFCGKSVGTITAASDLFRDEDEDVGPYMHSESYAVICDASKPLGPGGCGAQGGFMPTEAEAIARWNERAASLAAGKGEVDKSKMVPLEPTMNMIKAGAEHAIREDEDEDIYRARGQAIAIYKDMLAAAPAPSDKAKDPNVHLALSTVEGTERRNGGEHDEQAGSARMEAYREGYKHGMEDERSKWTGVAPADGVPGTLAADKDEPCDCGRSVGHCTSACDVPMPTVGRKRLCRDCADFAEGGICPNDGKPCSTSGVLGTFNDQQGGA